MSITKEQLMTELVLQENGLSIEEMSEALGGTSQSTGPKIPDLGMNYEPEDGPMGAFYLKTDEDRVYATEGVMFRAFSNHIQYQHWDDKELVNKSILVRNTREEARDQRGGLMCGMPSYEQSIQMSPEEKEKYKGIDRYRIVRGLVSYTGKTSQGKEVTIENAPCKLSLKRKNYGPFWHDVQKKIPSGVNRWDFNCLLSTSKEKNSYGKTYYVMHFTPQFADLIPMDKITYDSLAHVTSLVKAENARIEEAYKNAQMDALDAEEAERIMDAVDTLQADYVA
tara:strand:+ start:543 stop:1385 length:843 start_codon:yes stop_codon:yes gene_type:complete